MPTPVSLTAITRSPLLSLIQFTVTELPGLVNLTALEEDVEQDLLELGLIHPDRRLAQTALAANDYRLLLGQRTDRRDREVHETRHRDGGLFQLHLSRLDPRQVENSVDDFQQMHCRFVNVFRVFRVAILRLLRIELNDFREPDDRVQRRAQFVRHVGEKLGLRAIGCLRLQHFSIGANGVGFRVPLGEHQSEAGIAPVEHGSQLRTVALQQRFAYVWPPPSHCSSLQGVQRSPRIRLKW
jgi:hypothetical protein